MNTGWWVSDSPSLAVTLSIFMRKEKYSQSANIYNSELMT